jgi:hypothetical protein
MFCPHRNPYSLQSAGDGQLTIIQNDWSFHCDGELLFAFCEFPTVYSR